MTASTTEEVTAHQWELPALIGSAVIAGSAFLFTSFAKEYFPPLTLTTLRLGIGSLGLLGANVLHNGLSYIPLMSSGEFASLARIGLLNTVVPYTLYAIAMTQGVSVGLAAVMAGSAPLVVALGTAALDIPVGAWKTLRRPRKAAGLVLGFIGVFLIAVYKHLLQSGKEEHKKPASWQGTALQVVAVLCKAAASVLTQRHNGKFTPRPPALVQALVQTVAGLVLAFAFAAALDCTGRTPKFLDPRSLADGVGSCVTLLRDVPVESWWSVGYLGVFSSCIVYVLQFFLLARVGAVRQTLAEYLTPTVGVIEGFLFKADLEKGTLESVVLCVAGALLSVGGMLLNWPEKQQSVESCAVEGGDLSLVECAEGSGANG